MRALAGIAALVAACGVPAAQYPDTGAGPDAGVGTLASTANAARRPGSAVRVEATRNHSGLAAYAGVWRHDDPDQKETLDIHRTGEFDWWIERPNQGRCEIAGNVALVEGEPVAFAWSMSVNTCNSSYQGRTSNDLIIQHDGDTMTLKDAEFDIEPVSYVRDRF